MIRNNGIPIIRCISEARVKIFIRRKAFLSTLVTFVPPVTELQERSGHLHENKLEWSSETIIFQAIRVVEKKKLFLKIENKYYLRIIEIQKRTCKMSIMECLPANGFLWNMARLLLESTWACHKDELLFTEIKIIHSRKFCSGFCCIATLFLRPPTIYVQITETGV